MNRLELLRKTLKDTVPPVWAEPFHEAWTAAHGADPRVRLARAQAAEMAAARPWIKPGELIIGNNALRPIVTGLPTPFRSGVFFDRQRLEAVRTERPDAEAKLAEIEAYWSKWTAENAPYTPMAMHATLAYERVLDLGIDGLRDYVKYWAEFNAAARPDCAPWYEALLIVLDGVSAYIAAHARAAQEAGLEQTTLVCRHIAAGAPRSFHEAAQLFYLVFMLCHHDSPGPIDRYLWPALRRDLARGATSREQAQEILDCLWLKFEEKTAYGATLAGQRPDGSDATNELSFMCVDSIRRLRLLSPRTAVRWHRAVSPDFVKAACDCIASGASLPAIVNDEAIIPAMVERGIRLEHAREYTFVGCGQTYPHARGHGNYEDLVINSAKPLELTFNDGTDPMTGRPLGLHTGKPSSFTTWEQFERAYRRQMDHHIFAQIEAVNERRRRIKDRAHDFLRSLLTYSCVERGLDWHAGGADYSEGMVDMVGMTTVTDSLLAVKKAVYEDKIVSLEELAQALSRNWEGAEPLRQYLLRRVPKFGNDSDEADAMTANEVNRVNEFIKSHKTFFGGPWGMDIIGWSGAAELGSRTGATPDGRRRGEPLADCAGPAQGRNTRGLTATLNSTLKLPHRRAHGPMVLSLRFPKEVVKDEEGREKLRAVIETYMRQGGQQLQISIAGTEDMRAAQTNPELYEWLMVRVGGFSAYFTQLDKKFQDDMIARSQMTL